MTPVLAYWVDDLNPFLIRFTDSIGIRWYGLAYLAGFLSGAWLLIRYAQTRRTVLTTEQVSDLMVALVMGVLIGGRVGSYVLYDYWRTFREDPLFIFKIWEGGMASHGGILGVMVGLYWFSRKNRLPFLHVGDITVTVAPLGLFFGRIANFINGELWGKISVVPWAVIFPRSVEDGRPLSQIPPRHPSQLYEAALEGLFLFVYLQWRFRRTQAATRKPGRIAGEFFILYAVVRIIGEVFREPDSALVMGLSKGTFFSLFMIVVGAALWVWPAAPLSLPAPSPGAKR